jgi:hypothetical protein
MGNSLLIRPRAIKHDAGYSYCVKLRGDGWPGDNAEEPYQSRLILWEDDKCLGPAHSQHADIRSTGAGAYSHWHNFLYFSTSDRSDPRKNGRTYRCEVPEPGGDAELHPRIYLNCLPKSGSDYLVNLLCKGLRLRHLERGGGAFPESYLWHDYFSRVGYGWVYRGHEKYNRYHKYQIGLYLEKMVVHVRDPRAAVLSFTHYADTIARDSASLARYHHIDAGFLALSLTEKLDLMIDYMTPLMVEWIESWLQAERDPDFETRMLFTSFESFRESREKFLTGVLGFYGAQPARARDILNGLDIKSANFRKGEVDEWREVMSGRQRDRINRYLPDSLLERFSWSR